jgi:hypothetical protein
MEEGTKTKKTVFVGGIGDDVDESAIFEHFSTFGMLGILCSSRMSEFARGRGYH